MKILTAEAPCPCLSHLSFGLCCGPYLAGAADAPSADALMRSRYTAYALCNAAYLNKTHHASTRSDNLESSLEDSFKNCEWTGLKITSRLGGSESDNEGKVRFEASFVQQGKSYLLKETSRFVKENGCWLYVDGDGKIDAIKPSLPGRNDPCWCGSGKKFKKCHGG